jgi:hypothetical protein
MIWDGSSIPPSELSLEPAPVGARRCGHRRRARLAGGLCRRRRSGRARGPIIAAIHDFRVTPVDLAPAPSQAAGRSHSCGRLRRFGESIVPLGGRGRNSRLMRAKSVNKALGGAAASSSRPSTVSLLPQHRRARPLCHPCSAQPAARQSALASADPRDNVGSAETAPCDMPAVAAAVASTACAQAQALAGQQFAALLWLLRRARTAAYPPRQCLRELATTAARMHL